MMASTSYATWIGSIALCVFSLLEPNAKRLSSTASSISLTIVIISPRTYLTRDRRDGRDRNATSNRDGIIV